MPLLVIWFGSAIYNIKISSEYNQISRCIYSALITDTGSFRFNSTDSNSHKMAGFLIDKGVKPYNVYEKIYERRSLGTNKSSF